MINYQQELTKLFAKDLMNQWQNTMIFTNFLAPMVLFFIILFPLTLKQMYHYQFCDIQTLNIVIFITKIKYSYVKYYFQKQLGVLFWLVCIIFIIRTKFYKYFQYQSHYLPYMKDHPHQILKHFYQCLSNNDTWIFSFSMKNTVLLPFTI